MGCNTSQEQPSAVSENNGDIVNHNNESKQTPRNSAKSTKSAKSAKSDKLTNGHENQTSDDQKSEGREPTKEQKNKMITLN